MLRTRLAQNKLAIPRLLLTGIAGVVLCAEAALVVSGMHRVASARAMLALPPDQVVSRPALVNFADAEGAPLYAAHCARCHGARLQGDAAIGAPNLANPHWLYGSGRVFDIERTILFGIRSGDGRARNVAEMPAFGQAGILSAADITNVVDYLRTLQGHQTELSGTEGRRVYFGRGNCAECHGRDARGSSDLGAPNLTTGQWNHGGTRQDLYAAIFFGVHGICPGWQGRLSLADIRALAVYVYQASRGPAKS